MRRISILLALLAGLFAAPANAANFSAKDAAAATIIFTNPGNCTTGCTPIFSWFDSTGANAVAVLTAGADAASNTANGGLVYNRNMVFNGTTWDRWTGLVTAAQSGTWNITNISGTISLPTGAATSVKQSDGSQKSQTVDGSGNVQPAGDAAARAIFQKVTDGTNTAAVKAASTAAVAADPSVVTNESPNSQLSVATGTASDAPCASGSTTPCSLNARMAHIENLANSSTPAGENHIGEIASNQIKVQVAQTVTASAYSAGNALGGLMTVANAARVSGSAGAAGTGGILTGLQLNSKTIQTGVQVDVFIFDANPTGSTCTDKTAFVIAAADFDKVVGILTIPSTAANGAGWFGATTTGAVGIPTYYPVTYDLASSTSIYACAVVRAAITPAATTDISFKYNILRN